MIAGEQWNLDEIAALRGVITREAETCPPAFWLSCSKDETHHQGSSSGNKFPSL